MQDKLERSRQYGLNYMRERRKRLTSEQRRQERAAYKERLKADPVRYAAYLEKKKRERERAKSRRVAVVDKLPVSKDHKTLFLQFVQPLEVDYHTCSKCELTKPLSEFRYTIRRTGVSISGVCKKCDNDRRNNIDELKRQSEGREKKIRISRIVSKDSSISQWENIKADPVLHEAHCERNRGLARTRYNALKNDPVKYAAKLARARELYKQKMEILRSDPAKIEAHREKDREYYHSRKGTAQETPSKPVTVKTSNKKAGKSKPKRLTMAQWLGSINQ